MSRATVLIVDDESGGRDAMAAMLAGEDCDLVFAASGAEALARAAELIPDVVLLDVMMPGMDGFEVCRRLRADARLAEVPVIITTVLDDRASRLAGLEAGADELISKPLDRLELRTRLRALTRLNRSRRLLRERTAELEAANRELESFASAVAHDLRAPLRAIDSFGRALQEDCAAALGDEGRQFLDRILVNAERMSGLIADLLRLARLARAGLRREPVDLSAMAAAVVETLRQQEPGRSVEAVIAPGLMADADPGLTRVLLDNLIGNAWKFTRHRAGARIEVGAAPGEAGGFVVADNGAGFDMASAERLFRPFLRLHRAQDFEGTGIGLAAARRIVHRHGGRIWAEAALDQGARFSFTLEPAHDWAPPAAEAGDDEVAT